MWYVVLFLYFIRFQDTLKQKLLFKYYLLHTISFYLPSTVSQLQFQISHYILSSKFTFLISASSFSVNI